MLEKRYIASLVLLISFFTLASTVSASHFDITYTGLQNITVDLDQSGSRSYTINLTFNLTNTSALRDDDLEAQSVNITNVSIFAILPNGTEVELALNNTENDFLEAVYNVGFTYQFDREIIFNSTVVSPDQEGDIPLNITVDVFNGTNATVIFNESISFLSYAVFVDATPPGITIKFLDAQDNEKTTFPATDPVKIVCTRSSATANSATAASLVPSFNDTNISIQTPLTSSFDTLESDSVRDTLATEFTVTFTQTRDLGDYIVACYSIDDLGSINDTVNATFTILKKPPSGVSPFVNSEFKPPVATILVGDGTVSSLDPLTEEGSSRLMAKGSAVSFMQGDKAYTLTLKEYTDTSATYTVAGGTSFDVTVPTQETKPADVDGDGQDDVSITLHQVYNKKADTTFKMITVQQGSKQKEETKEETKEPIITQEASPSSGWGMIVFIFLVVLFILGALHFFASRRRGGNASLANGNVRFTPKDLGLQRPPEEPRTFTRY